MLIIFAGLPCTGKTTLAKELAHRTGAVLLHIDSIGQAIMDSSLPIRSVEEAGYLVGYALAEENLRLGRTVLADSVNPIALTRNAWLAVARRASCSSVEVEAACSDRGEHRRRVESRRPDIAGLTPPTWRDVLEREYHPWIRDRVVIDTAGRTVGQSLEELQSHLAAVAPSPQGGSEQRHPA